MYWYPLSDLHVQVLITSAPSLFRAVLWKWCQTKDSDSIGNGTADIKKIKLEAFSTHDSDKKDEKAYSECVQLDNHMINLYSWISRSEVQSRLCNLELSGYARSLLTKSCTWGHAGLSVSVTTKTRCKPMVLQPIWWFFNQMKIMKTLLNRRL